MVDTHSHVALCEGSAADVVARAREAGVRHILTVGLDEESNADAARLAREHEEVFASVGRHPNSAEGYDDAAEAALRELAANPGVAAIGETGLDYFRDGAPRSDQRRAFRSQIEVARDAGLPLVIHMRSGEGDENDAVSETLDLLAADADGVTVILHCFSAPPDRVGDAAERGWYCSFAGNVTYPRAHDLREAAALVPDELILVETDAPFLAPQAWRGKPNEPAYVVETARVVAEARGVRVAELEATVEENAARLFGW